MTQFPTDVTSEERAITWQKIKWSEKKSAKLPNAFVEAYHPECNFTINKDNCLEFFTGDALKHLSN